MSTVVAVVKNNQICIGADTRGTWSNTAVSHENSSSTKLIEWEGVGTFAVVGNAAAKIPFSMFLEAYEKPAKITNTTLYVLLRDFIKHAKEYELLQPDITESLFHTYQNMLFACPTGAYAIDSQRGVYDVNKYFAMGSGEDFAMGAMAHTYPLKYTAEQIALAGLESAAELDIYSGVPLETVVMKKKRS